MIVFYHGTILINWPKTDWLAGVFRVFTDSHEVFFQILKEYVIGLA